MSLNNINNNANVINVGRTTPITPGPQPASKSLPVVISTDQQSIPVEEQNKIQSEVALSLLGIPRAEVALGIFADVNTYDVNPTEWSEQPEQHFFLDVNERNEHTGIAGRQGWGTKHLPEESGALVEAPADETAVLTSKRFFRYQPGRVSSATFGIKSTSTSGDIDQRPAFRNPPIRKYGIFDKFDGYYWETRDTSQQDQFAVVRRTQSIFRYNPVPFGSGAGEQVEDHALGGKPSDSDRVIVGEFPRARDLISANRFSLIEDSATNTDPKCFRDLDFVIDAYINDLEFGGDGHISVNATTYRTALLLGSNNEQQQHENLRDNIVTLLNNNGQTDAANRITALSTIQINAVQGVQPNVGQIDYGQRSKLETIFSIYNKFYGYLVSESIDYDTSDPVRNFSGAEYEEFLKFKCVRDVKYVMEAFGKDLEFGGDASTIYQAFKYYKDGELQVFSQTNNDGIVREKEAHEFLQSLLIATSPVTITRTDGTTVNIASLSQHFNLTSSQTAKLENLSDIIINNFDERYSGRVDFGSADQFGDIVILRDGLIMTHAALYDPSLLLDKEKAVAQADDSTNTVTTSGRRVIIGQYVNYYGDAGGLVDGKTYFVHDVRGPKENILSLVDPMDGDFPETKNIVNITSAGTESFIETPVPFIFPDEYDEPYPQGDTKYDGMFPYLYTLSGILPEGADDFSRGFIDTAIDTSVNASELKTQIEAINYEFRSWVRDHVDPRYYSVYEYRVPRSRFSGDSLDGETRRAVYADNVLDRKAGEFFVEGGLSVEQSSVWDFDFSKVTMLKIEFSWYGAVGALFLAYVPVGNGEARWVRVHHLRASNQLKISSLGNATLPMTYLVYGGGSESRFGPQNETRLVTNYDSYSENVVKYGSSYYIDGGDRGTVRLFNHSSDSPSDIYGSRYELGIDNTNVDDPLTPRAVVTSLNNSPPVNTFYMNASVITGNSQDQNVRIIWVDPATNTVFFNRPISQVSTLNIIVNRPEILYGIKAKDFIVSGEQVDVRNRVQVYPTRLSLGTTGSASGKISLVKTPIFQKNTPTSGSLTVTQEVNLSETTQLSVDNTDYLSDNGDFVYGYFQALIEGSLSFISILGRLEKQNDQLFFESVDIFNRPVRIEAGSEFLKEGIFDSQGNSLSFDETVFDKERLSSINISQVTATPIPRTGQEVAAYYASQGSQEFDLLTYFDFNKEFISFPLTDAVESLYLAGTSNAQNQSSPILSISASLTWEEQ